jgi:hypothetical protein
MRRTWPVLASYAIFSMWGIGCFIASLVLTSGGLGLNPGDWGILGGVLAAVAIGHILGNILGLAGFRLVPISVIFWGAIIAATMSAAALGVFAAFLIVAVIAAYGGYLGVASRFDVFASWYPLTFCVGGAIHWMNAHRAVETFNTGAKYALWDAFTIVCLAGGVFWMLLFLATRNSLSLTVWQEVARPKMADATSEDAVAVARPGRGSILVLMAFTLIALGTTALVSPYLFRTVDHDGKDGKGQQEADGDKESQGQGDGSEYKGKKTKGKGKSTAKNGDGSSKSKGGRKQRGQRGHGRNGDQGDQGDQDPGDDPDTESGAEAAKEAAELGIKILAYLLAAALFLLFLYLAVLPPIKRAFLMRHLQKPLWPVAPTGRVMNHWRRALAVLAVAGIEPSAGETATDFAKRATAEVKEQLHCDAPGLADAAAIVEKIAYAGRGLGTADEQAVKEATTRFIDVVRPHIKLRKRFAASWGRAPEVEADSV